MIRRAQVFLLLALLALTGSSPTGQESSNLYTIGGVTTIRFTRSSNTQDVAYDAVNGEYMMANQSGDTYLLLQAVTASGLRTRPSPEIDLSSLEYGGIGPQIVDSPDIANSQFSSGYLIVWAQQKQYSGENLIVYAQTLVTQGMSLGTRATVSDPSSAVSRPTVAYSRTSRRFLAVWSACLLGDCSRRAVQARLLGLDGQPIGPITDIASGPNARSASVIWNGVTNEFAVVSSAGFARVGPDGRVLSRLNIPSSNGLEANANTGNYVLLKSTSSFGVEGTEISASGRVVSRGIVSSESFVGHNLAFNRQTGTFLLSGQTRTVELNGHGALLSAPILSPGCGGYPVERRGTPEWRVWGVGAEDRDKCTIAIGTTTRGGGSSTRLGGCTSADPFESVGGGFCENGAWVAPGNEPSDVPQPVIPPQPTMSLLFHHQTRGELAEWTMNGRVRLDALALTPNRVPDIDWQIVGTGDFNADGKTDILWQHLSDGFLAVWTMDGTTRLDAAFLTPNRFSDPAWRVRAVADLNRDGKPDLVIQHSTVGWVGVWYMNGTTLVDGRLFSPAATEIQWQIVGAPDLNSDGSPDILFQHDDGHLAVWFMQNAVRSDVQYLSPNRVPDARWRVRAVGDINADSRSDLILQHTESGQLAAWLMNGITLIDGVLLSPDRVEPVWRLAGPR